MDSLSSQFVTFMIPGFIFKCLCHNWECNKAQVTLSVIISEIVSVVSLD